ncbi:MAG: HNH endonuclease [Actinomycetota bacterium]|nr:HNH endonuclease [Actinomycetota bacterium]
MDGSANSPRKEATRELTCAQRAVGAAQRRLLAAIAECERIEAWREDDAEDLAAWVSGELGLSRWAARRRIAAAGALPHLPRLTTALEEGSLSIEKVVELCRFAQPATEKKLISWARRVSLSAIKDRADREKRPPLDEIAEDHKRRSFSFWWTDEGRFLQLAGSLPADQGAVVASALDRMAGRLPDIILDEDELVFPEDSLDARRADALYTMASATIANDQDADRATVVVHADLGALAGDGGCEVQGAGAIHAETARRLACDGRIQLALHDDHGQVVGVGRVSRIPPPWIQRLLRHRDGGCTFPACENKRFLHAHHIHHWVRGGETNMDNLVLICSSHHRLVHEYRWGVELDPDGATRWFRPSGIEYLPAARAIGLPERAPPLIPAVI